MKIGRERTQRMQEMDGGFDVGHGSAVSLPRKRTKVRERPIGRGNGPFGDRALPCALGIQYAKCTMQDGDFAKRSHVNREIIRGGRWARKSSERPIGRGNGPLGDRALPYALGIQYHWNQISERSEWRPMRVEMNNNRVCKMLAFMTLGMEAPGFWRLPPRQNVRLLFACCSLNFHFLFFVKCFGTGNRWEGGGLKL